MVPPKPQSKARLPDARFPVWSMSIKGFLLEHGATIRRRDQNVAIKAVERAHLWHFTGLGCRTIEEPQKSKRTSPDISRTKYLDISRAKYITTA
ncbi:hypothetical protein [Bradyrhizobium viridifuturi]|uniref:hypothetical protein n=1 Tax=Bradyrhizobium viridifuturi TaxID=1654716 RepID=UPI000AA39798|nr:hypothetical protein [Bradyrhizobium viridifuturi]